MSYVVVPRTTRPASGTPAGGGRAPAAAAAGAGGLEEAGISVNRAQTLGNPDVEARTAEWRAARAAAYDARAAAARRAAGAAAYAAWRASGGAPATWPGPDRDAGRWWAARARGLRAGWTSRAQECGRRHVAVGGCASCSASVAVPVRCGMPSWCASCADDYRRRFFVMTSRALARALDLERAAWRRAGAKRGMRPDITMVTLTVRDTGDVAADRERIARAWRRMRAWLHHRDGRAMPYVMTWEITAGTHGRGHVHAHVAAIWPWRDLRALDSEWVRATAGEGRTVDVRGQGARSPRAAARYVAAYVDGVGASADTPDDVRAAWVCATYGRRRYAASVGMYADDDDAHVVTCPACADGHVTGWMCRPARRPDGSSAWPWVVDRTVEVPRMAWARPPPAGPPPHMGV